MFNKIKINKDKILYTAIVGLGLALLFTNDIIYVEYKNYSLTLGYTIEMTLDEQIQANKDALNDPEIDAILADARERGLID